MLRLGRHYRGNFIAEESSVWSANELAPMAPYVRNSMVQRLQLISDHSQHAGLEPKYSV